jgi:hypothetical protein
VVVAVVWGAWVASVARPVRSTKSGRKGFRDTCPSLSTWLRQRLALSEYFFAAFARFLPVTRLLCVSPN